MVRCLAVGGCLMSELCIARRDISATGSKNDGQDPDFHYKIILNAVLPRIEIKPTCDDDGVRGAGGAGWVVPHGCRGPPERVWEGGEVAWVVVEGVGVYKDLGAFWDEAGIEVCERWEDSSWVGPHCGPMDVPCDAVNPDL